MATPEEVLARFAQAEIKGAEIRGRIARAERWDQLFATEEEADACFKNLIDAHRFYYEKNDPSVEYSVESHPDGDIHRVVKHKGYDSTYQRLSSGNVTLTFYYPDPGKSPSVNLITPSIGNIAHPFTSADVAIPEEDTLHSLMFDDPDLRDKCINLTFLFSHLKGKPATQGWENIMTDNGYMPQRIGYTLYPGYAIEALAKLRVEHPQFVVRP
ncbi:MAG: hypothetical protein Q7K55_05730 [Candidatus Levybacteria bacterium]|nr:hypothetical protein [Candidatus Levybacteria bacterium]